MTREVCFADPKESDLQKLRNFLKGRFSMKDGQLQDDFVRSLCVLFIRELYDDAMEDLDSFLMRHEYVISGKRCAKGSASPSDFRFTYSSLEELEDLWEGCSCLRLSGNDKKICIKFHNDTQNEHGTIEITKVYQN